jgi:hypothetical protein
VSFRVNGYLVAELQIARVTPVRQVGFSQLLVDFKGEVHPPQQGWPRPVTLSDIRGRAFLVEDSRELVLGRLEPPTVEPLLVQAPNQQSATLTLALDVTSQQLAFMGAKATEKTLIVYFDLFAVAALPWPTGGSMSVPHSTRLSQTFTAPAWTALLDALSPPFAAPAGWDATLAAYFRLAIETFNAAVPEAALFFIGGAAERLIELTGTGALQPIVNAKKWSDAEKSKKTSDKVAAVIDALVASKKVDQRETDWLNAQATLYRVARNDIGHPQPTPPRVPRNEVETRIRTFDEYKARMDAAVVAALKP